METELTNQMLLDIISKTFKDVNADKIERIRIAKEGRTLFIELDTKEDSGKPDLRMKTGDKIKVSMS